MANRSSWPSSVTVRVLGPLTRPALRMSPSSRVPDSMMSSAARFDDATELVSMRSVRIPAAGTFADALSAAIAASSLAGLRPATITSAPACSSWSAAK